MFSHSLVASPQNPFWQFSLAVYNDVEIRQACHAFQDINSANVNLILFAYWLGYAVEDISHDEFTHACNCVALWNKEITKPLRKIRILLKDISNNDWIKRYYSHILTDEIISESYQQELLYNQIKHRIKERATQNNTLSYQYLSWLFNNMGQELHESLKIRIEYFIQIMGNRLDCIQKP